MRSLLLLLVTTALVGCEPTGAADSALISFDFDSSADGWHIAADTGDVDPTYHPDGGAGGGYISGTDEAVGETWYFAAPPALLARLPSAAGGELRYQLKQSAPMADFPDDDVVIQGPAGRLSYRFAHAPGTEWRAFAVPLTASAGWRWNWNADATDAQMQSVLRDATRLYIRGEYVTGDDEAGLDSVRISAAR